MEPRFVDLPGFHVAGLAGRYVVGGTEGIPSQWEELVRRWTGAGRPCPPVGYGVCYGESAGADAETAPFTYVAAFPAEAAQEAPAGLEVHAIPSNRYAVFTHRGPVVAIQDTYAAIFGDWLPTSGYRRAAGPDFERYDERFDERTMAGEVDIYLPVERSP